jgi:hypothetical protein
VIHDNVIAGQLRHVCGPFKLHFWDFIQACFFEAGSRLVRIPPPSFRQVSDLVHRTIIATTHNILN